MIKEVEKRLGGASEEDGDEADQNRPEICRVPDPRLTAGEEIDRMRFITGESPFRKRV